MAQKKPVVEIIPWVHSAEYQAHADVVEYIKKLPKNSHVLMEITPTELGFVGKIEDLFIGQRANLRGLGRMEKSILSRLSGAGMLLRNFIEYPSSDLWAVLEIMQGCRKRNITIIPLETTVSYAVHKKSDYWIPTKESEAAERFREATFARQIQANSSKFSGDILPALVGSLHAFGLKTELEKLGMRAIVSTSMFTHRQSMENKLWAFVELRKVIRTGDRDNITRMTSLSNRISDTKPLRRESLQAIAVRIAIEIHARAARPERKLAERKQKLAARLARQQRRK